jgi:hypothetical protein
MTKRRCDPRFARFDRPAVEADRATSILLVTDGVTNDGIFDAAEFDVLLKKYDMRVFGFLMGNNANWPLMRLIAETSAAFMMRFRMTATSSGRSCWRR